MFLQGKHSLGLLLPSEGLQSIVQLWKLVLLELGLILFFEGLVKEKELMDMLTGRLWKLCIPNLSQLLASTLLSLDIKM